MLTLAAIRALFAAHGSRMYSGEPVTQLEHALQTAALAEEEGAPATLVTFWRTTEYSSPRETTTW